MWHVSSQAVNKLGEKRHLCRNPNFVALDQNTNRNEEICLNWLLQTQLLHNLFGERKYFIILLRKSDVRMFLLLAVIWQLTHTNPQK